ncbi:ribosome biogenesis protein YTM1 [Trypanosoma rangeli]|uniref:Ribosome biogenesis protein YTM1 n=1 Tax=Trypanosoma rangeli TaxID=5698 RepID=A0A3S5IQK0_TRYRA|nr:ribosome biogenesis protein YTM1 [Trypanosoma rangeli]RNF00717.1 ribosome biogenesis protein YTM1 [Trypanosoma rangeli]|eukprot:RNF00717.1 ribosome biogenesis protein YTM1 [Trypanosoma rangeli]
MSYVLVLAGFGCDADGGCCCLTCLFVCSCRFPFVFTFTLRLLSCSVLRLSRRRSGKLRNGGICAVMPHEAPLQDAAGVERQMSAQGGHVVVTFFTTSFPKAMPEQSYSVPLDTLPEGLNTLVQSVLAVEGHTFDFILNDEYISTSLHKFLARRGISYEELLNIEYTPALQAKEGSLLPHDDWVSSVRAPFLGGVELLLTASYDHCVRLWDGENCVALGTYHNECVKEVCLHPVRPTTSSTDAAALSRKRKRAAAMEDFMCVSCSKDGSIVAWQFDGSLAQFTPLGVVKPHIDGVDSVDVSPGSGEYVASASWDGTVKVFQWSQLLDAETPAASKAPLVSFTDHTRPVLSCRFSATDGPSLLYSAGLDGAVKSLSVERAVLLSNCEGDHPIQGIAVKPAGGGGDLIITACTDNRARLYDTREKKIVKTFSGHRQWLYAATWAWRREEGEQGGSHLFATASEDSTVRVWDLRSTSAALLTLDTMHTDGVLDVTYAGGSQIASGGKDNKTRSFSLSKGEDGMS